MSRDRTPGFMNAGVREVMKSLFQIQLSTHTILVYPNAHTLREIYTNYIDNYNHEPNELFVLLPFYETIDSVKNNLMDNYESTQNYEYMKHNASLVIQDANTIFKKDIISNTDYVLQRYVEPPNIIDFMNRVSLHSKKINVNTISLWIDTGVFYNFENGIDSLMNYERASPRIVANYPIKQICLYHQKDFENRLNKFEQIKTIDTHQKKLLMVDKSR
jgi:hypothetical protein